MLEAREPELLRYSWQDAAGGEITEVTYRVEPHEHLALIVTDLVAFPGS